MLPRNLLICLWLVLLCSYKLKSQPVIFQQPLSPRNANYDIDVRLDAEKRILHGQEVITWYNKSNDTISELQFHLYLNAFRNNQSTFMKESGGLYRDFKRDKDRWGFIEVNRITLSSGDDLTDRMKFIHPDDDNEDDKTVFRLLIPRPISPGKSIVLNIDFTAKLPQPPIARTGAKKEYFFVGQWFPKIGVYINGKWNCHQFHRISEFFADFGIYNVRMTVPEKNIVGATGVEVEVINNGDGTATHFYHAEDVHDFAWTTSPEFIEVTGTAQDVSIRVLMQPDHKNQAQRHLEAAKVAVEYFQNWYGDYPFPNLTVVDPRRGALATGGMEYPTLITGATFYGLPEGIRLVEDVVIHEFGHNYWYHLVASNEFEEPWLDEGINTYSEIQILNDHYGSTGDLINFLGIQINDLQHNRSQYIFKPDLDPIVKNAWDFYSGGSYAINSYSKAAIVLTTLQNYLGKEIMQNIMRTYFERWQFKHPKTQDFINLVNQISQQDLNWFFDQALFTNVVLDYSIDRVISRKLKGTSGYDFSFSVSENEKSEIFTTESDTPLFNSNQIDSFPDSLDLNRVEDKLNNYYSQVYVRRLGEFKFPVEIKVYFENGEIIHERWDGQELWKKFYYIMPTRLVSATVDPDGKIPLDVNFTNNSRTIKKQTRGINKLSIRWLFWMQFLLDQPEFLNLLYGLKSGL